ncbi:MAG: hypothetical protein GXY47_01720 [Acidobacteria bacterium]|nr:hypothetical protein [Acidobacteriota bacterium]
MEYAYHHGDPGRLYLNVTNRCSNRCSFCVRGEADGLEQLGERGGPPVTAEAVWDSVLDFIARAPAHFEEVQATVVGHALAPGEIDACRTLALALGAHRVRVR